MAQVSLNQNQLYWVQENRIEEHFPPVEMALRDPDGLLAIGGDLSSERLLNAYQQGIFPWYSDGQPILWWSPDPRCVLELDKLKLSRSLKKTLKKQPFHVSFNLAFADVVRACAAPREYANDTWITEPMFQAYSQLHQMQRATSVECWYDKNLVGGLYGVMIGKVFFGESMFSRVPDASKVALVYLADYLQQQQVRIIDCQVHSPHLQSLGAESIPRPLFINLLREYAKPELTTIWPSGYHQR